MQEQRTPQKKRQAIPHYFHSILLIAGLIILLFIILDHLLHNGRPLSQPEKITFIVFCISAFFLIVSGLWDRITKGRLLVTRLSGGVHLEIDDKSAAGPDRYLRWLVLLTAYAVIFAAYLDIKSSIIHLDAARNFTDTSGYVETGSYALSDIRFWTGRRAFTVPLFYKLSGFTRSNYDQQDAMERVSRYQSLFSIFSWAILALSFSLRMKPYLAKIAAFGTMLLLGASLYVTQWERSMLAESISLSCMILLLGLLIMAGLLWDRKKPVSILLSALLSLIILLSAILFAFSRDTNPYWLLAIAGLMLIGLLFPSTRRHLLFRFYLVILVGFLAIFTLSNLTLTRSRYVNSLLAVVVDRMIPDHQSLDYLIAHGMPYDERYKSLTSLNLKKLFDVATTDQTIRPLYTWISDNGMRVIAIYLLEHPLYTLSAPFMDFQNWGNITNGGYRRIITSTPSRIQFLSEIIYFPFGWSPVVLLALFFICFWIIWHGKQHNSLLLINLFLFISAYPLSLLIWHSDPGELSRHIFQVSFQLRLAAWMTILLIIERGLILIQKREPNSGKI
jgi:hypothetical protein